MNCSSDGGLNRPTLKPYYPRPKTHPRCIYKARTANLDIGNELTTKIASLRMSRPILQEGGSSLTEIHRVNLTKSKLTAMPQAERSLLLLLGHANNEINVLSKLILMARKDKPEIKLIDHVEAGQVFIILRVLIGKLHEA